MKFNPEQQKAIDTIDKNVCLIAGAGTGKTSVLTNRFIKILLSDENSSEAFDSILAITFTEKATKKMYSDISKLIFEYSKEFKELEVLKKYIPYANISTIHGFCMRILKENGFKIGLDSNFEIMNEIEAKKILNKIVMEILSDKLKSDEVLESMMLDLNLQRVSDLKNELILIYNYIINKGYNFDDLLEKTFINIPECIYLEKLFLDIDAALLILKENKIYNNRNKNLLKVINSPIKNKIEEKSASEDEIYDWLKNLSINLDSLTKKESVTINLVEKINRTLAYYEKSNIEYIKIINEILKEIDFSFKNKKVENKSLEYSDLLYFANEILDDKEILKKYQDKFKYVMIDEFQDTNSLQREIFYKICSREKLLDRNNFFVVGDSKQSIYGFRGSDLSVFEKTIEDIKNSGGEIITLCTNYRSSKELVEFSNQAFSKILEKNYTVQQSFQEYENFPVEVVRIDDEKFSEPNYIARRILELKKDHNYSDIAVLFRNTNKLKSLADELKKFNIPYVNPKSREFLEKREIKDLILYLKFINNPEDDVNLYGLLRSNFFFIKDEDLFSIIQNGKNMCNSLFDYSGSDENIKFAKNILKKYLEKSAQENIYTNLSEFVAETKFLEFLASISTNTQAIENVELFKEKLFDFSIKSIGTLLEFIDELVLNTENDVEEAAIDLGQDEVKLMTIHAAKGLEFPVVILYDSTTQSYSKMSKIIADGELGYAINFEKGYSFYQNLKNEFIKKDEFEEDRLLYVAVTRARNKFIFFDKTHSKSYKQINDKSYFGKLINLKYDYCINQNIEEFKDSPAEAFYIEGRKDSDLNPKVIKLNKIKTASFTQYSLFNKCRREFFYKYILKMPDFLDSEEYDENYIEYENEAEKIKASKFGTLVHALIEKYDKSSDLEVLIEALLKENGIEENDEFTKKLKKYFENYKTHYFEGEKYKEFRFILKFKYGKMSGSIDEIRIKDKKIQIVDFKTNRMSNIDKLVNYYEPQLALYSLAAQKMFKDCEIESYIHFLENDKIVRIDDGVQNLKFYENNFNKFLKYISENDNIDAYQCSDSCDEFCKFKKLCDWNKYGN